MLIRGANIFGIKRIVINRQVVWIREPAVCMEGSQLIWRKIEGGKGFDPDTAAGTRKATKNPQEMANHVDHLLSLYTNTGVWQGHEVCSDRYRWWITCETGTLNIVLNNLRKKKKGKRS